MTKSKWIRWISMMLLWVAPGATLMGTSCGAELRSSVIGAGADCAGDSFGAILGALFPVEDWVTPAAS